MCYTSCSLYARSFNLLCTSCTVLFGICNWRLTCRTERFGLRWNATRMCSVSSFDVLGLPGECPFTILPVSWTCWYHLRIDLSGGAYFRYTRLKFLWTVTTDFDFAYHNTHCAFSWGDAMTKWLPLSRSPNLSRCGAAISRIHVTKTWTDFALYFRNVPTLWLSSE
jgi:hypothetical protein